MESRLLLKKAKNNYEGLFGLVNGLGL